MSNRLILAILIFAVTLVKSRAQGLTYGEIYDYQVGDEFATEFQIESTAPVFTKVKVLSRKDYGSDSIVYSLKRTIRKLNGQNIYIFTTDAYTFRVVSLSQPFFSGFQTRDSVSFDTTFKLPLLNYRFHDTVYPSNCDQSINRRSESFTTPLSGGRWYDTFVYKGVGVFTSVHVDGNFNTNHRGGFLYSIRNNCFNGDSFSYRTMTVSKTNVRHSFYITPNPANNFIKIRNEGIFSYTIYSLAGVKIQEGRQSENVIPLDERMTKGLYFITIQSDDGNYSSLLIKE